MPHYCFHSCTALYYCATQGLMCYTCSFSCPCINPIPMGFTACFSVDLPLRAAGLHYCCRLPALQPCKCQMVFWWSLLAHLLGSSLPGSFQLSLLLPSSLKSLMPGIFPDCISHARSRTMYPQLSWFHRLPKSPYETNRPYGFDNFARNTLFMDGETVIVYFKCCLWAFNTDNFQFVWCEKET